MKVLVVGEQSPGQLAWLCARGFARLGAGVAWVNTGGHPLERYRASRWPPLSVMANFFQKHWVNRQLIALAAALRPELIFVTKGEEIRASTLLQAKHRSGARLANWNPDSPLNPLNTTADLLAGLPLYDAYFTWGRFLVPEIERLGAQQAGYLPFACDPDLHRPVDVPQAERVNWGNDLTFVGTWEPERERWLEQVTGFDLGIWGHHWERALAGSHVRARWRGEAHGERLARVYSASHIALNFIRAQNATAHNMRTFEAPACGILMLATRTAEQVELLGEDTGAAFFETVDELRDKARFYLTHPDKRLAVAAGGRERVSRGHTYTDRMATVLALTQK